VVIDECGYIALFDLGGGYVPPWWFYLVIAFMALIVLYMVILYFRQKYVHKEVNNGEYVEAPAN
jgi:hypothetical protein